MIAPESRRASASMRRLADDFSTDVLKDAASGEPGSFRAHNLKMGEARPSLRLSGDLRGWRTAPFIFKCAVLLIGMLDRCANYPPL